MGWEDTGAGCSRGKADNVDAAAVADSGPNLPERRSTRDKEEKAAPWTANSPTQAPDQTATWQSAAWIASDQDRARA